MDAATSDRSTTDSVGGVPFFRRHGAPAAVARHLGSAIGHSSASFAAVPALSTRFRGSATPKRPAAATFPARPFSYPFVPQAAKAKIAW